MLSWSASRSGLTRRRLLRNGLTLAGCRRSRLARHRGLWRRGSRQRSHRHRIPPGAAELARRSSAHHHRGRRPACRRPPTWGSRCVREVVDAAAALNSDLVVILGDYFATHKFVTERVPHAAWAAELARLKAPLGVYAILGNHDWALRYGRHPRGASPCRHSADAERRRAAGRSRQAVLAGRARRSDRPPARALSV